MNYHLDLGVRLNAIRELEQSILEEPIRFYRLKKINELMSARENFRLQFYNHTSLKEPELKYLLSHESISFIKFQEQLISKFSHSNTEFASILQNILDTCEQSHFLDDKQIVEQSKQSLINITKKVQKSSNIMKKYRLRDVKKCQNILEQYIEDNFENKPKSIAPCPSINKAEMNN